MSAMLSIVVPCHNEAAGLPTFLGAIERVTAEMRAAHPGLSVEVVLVDDGSTDATLDVVRVWAARMASTAEPAEPAIRVAWLSFSRNFGKEAALYAGLQRATGDLVATMDADMQDPPDLLPQMLDTLLADPEIDNVATRRVTRAGEPRVRSWAARRFYRLINAVSQTEIADGARDYRLMRRPMVDAVLSLGERSRFSKGIFSWVGFRTVWLEYENVERVAGETNWSFWKLLAYAVDGITAFSTKPLQVAAASGAGLCLVTLAMVVFLVVRRLAFGDPVAGWASLACIIIFLGGVQLLCLGIIGQYLAKTYVESKHRPLYVVRRSSDAQGAERASGANGAGSASEAGGASSAGDSGGTGDLGEAGDSSGAGDPPANPA